MACVVVDSVLLPLISEVRLPQNGEQIPRPGVETPHVLASLESAGTATPGPQTHGSTSPARDLGQQASSPPKHPGGGLTELPGFVLVLDSDGMMAVHVFCLGVVCGFCFS